MRALTGRCGCVFVSGTDLPLLHPEFVRSLAQALDGYEAVAPVTDGRSHPLTAVYRIEALSHVEMLLTDDRRRATALLESAAARRLDAAALPHPESLRNVNTPQEYAQAIAEPEPEIVIEAIGAAGRLLGFTRFRCVRPPSAADRRLPDRRGARRSLAGTERRAAAPRSGHPPGGRRHDRGEVVIAGVLVDLDGTLIDTATAERGRWTAVRGLIEQRMPEVDMDDFERRYRDHTRANRATSVDTGTVSLPRLSAPAAALGARSVGASRATS